MPEIAPLGDYGEVKVPNLLDIQAKQAQTDKYNLDVAGAARDFYALKQYGEGAARGDPEATIQLNAKNPEAGNILANIGKTTIETKQAKENLVKGAAARVAQTASQFSDPAIQTQVFHNGIDLLLSQRAISQAEADNYKNMASVDPQGMIRGIIHGNLGAKDTPLVAGQAAQREAEGREPADSRLARQRGSYNPPITITDPGGKTARGYNPTEQPGAIPATPGPGGAVNEFGVPIAPPVRPGSGSSTEPGAVRTSGVTTAPSTYIPGSGPSSAPEIPAPPEQFKGMISAAATKHGVPEELLTRVLHGESGYNPNNVGPMTRHGTAKGIAQFIDSTAQSRGVKQFDPASSIDGAAAYLAELKQQRGSWYGAISGYLGAPPNPRNNRSYFDSGVVQTARSLDARGAAPPAPGSTAPPPAPGSSLPIPGPASATPSPASVPPLVTPPGSSSATTPEIPPLSSTTARTAPRAAGVGFDLAAGDSIAYGAVRHAKLPGKEIGTVPRDSSQVQYDAAGSRNPTQALEYIEANADRLKGKKIFWSSGLMNAGKTAEIAEGSLPQVEEQLSQLVHNGNSVVLAGVDQGKYASLNPRLQELVDKVEAEKGDATGSVRFGGPLPTNNVHPGPPGYRDYVSNAAKMLEEKRSDAEPEALSGGSAGPVPTTASSAGEDTTSPTSSYDTPATTPSSTTLSGADRAPITAGGGYPVATEADKEAEKARQLAPIELKKQTDELDTLERKQKLDYEQKQKEADLQHQQQERGLALEQRKAGSKAAVDAATTEYSDVAKRAAGARAGEQNIPLIERALERFRTGSTGNLRQAALEFVTDFSGALGIEATEAQKQAAAASIIKTGGGLLSFDMVNSLGAREAVQVVNQVMSIKPSLVNSPGANKIIIEAIRQDFARKKDMHAFFDEWRANPDNKNPETYIGAATAFEKAHPVAQYASKVTPFPLPVTNDHKIDTDQLQPGVIYEVGGIMNKKGTTEKLPPGAQWKWNGKSWEDAGKAKEYR